MRYARAPFTMFTYTVLFITFHVYCCALNTDYENKRAEILREESLLTLGGHTILNMQEQMVNNCLMGHKIKEVDYGFNYPEYFNFSHHYFTYKEKIKDSKVYNIIKDMPKGALLHIHDMGILGPDYVLNITYMDHLYVCFDNNKIQMRFSKYIPNLPCSDKWILMNKARYLSKNVTQFDANLRKHFTLVVDNPDTVYPNIKDTWSAFMSYFNTIYQILSYRPIWEQYFYDCLKKFQEENIMYVEIRSILPQLYELDGTIYDQVVTAKAYQKAINRFMKDNPDFVGAKLIFAPTRFCTINKLKDDLQVAKRIKEAVPEMFAGFDLVDREDLMPLMTFVPELINASNELTYFFHAGETDWYGTPTDDNLVDAILLGSKRIGHGYALVKHPVLLEEVIKRDIALEVNVISNQVLSLVRDVRNHPLSVFLSKAIPLVISSDDPGIWEADTLSQDFYITFVGVASRLSDLRLLKKLITNSIKYSALVGDAKAEALSKLDFKWNQFVNNFNCSKY